MIGTICDITKLYSTIITNKSKSCSSQPRSAFYNNNSLHEPVSSSRQRSSLGTNVQRKDFSGIYPTNRLIYERMTMYLLFINYHKEYINERKKKENIVLTPHEYANPATNK